MYSSLLFFSKFLTFFLHRRLNGEMNEITLITEKPMPKRCRTSKFGLRLRVRRLFQQENEEATKKRVKKQHVKKKSIARPRSIDVDKVDTDTQIHVVSTFSKSTYIMVIPLTVRHRQDAPSSHVGQVLF